MEGCHHLEHQLGLLLQADLQPRVHGCGVRQHQDIIV